jgi:outer membrane porin, OprD family
MRFLYSVIALLLCSATAFSQHQEIATKPAMWKGKQENMVDTSSLLYAFKSGTVNGHFRYFFMSTDNAKGLTNFYANAAGGGIRYETAKFKGFQFAVSGFYIFNIGSSDLAKKDPLTGLGSRYETTLFDIEDPHNKIDLDRLEEFYLKYNFKKSHITFGRQLINTPFINLQDGRMRPTGVEGVWMEINDLPKTILEGGLLYAISPRGTVKWYGVGESMGIYPAGINTDGTKSGYPGNVEASNLMQVGVHHEISTNTKLHAWNLLVPKVFNAALLQLDYSLPTQQKGHQYYGSLQAVKQHALKDGGNEDPAKRFIEKDNGAFSFGARVGYKTPIWDFSLNYNRITKEGRYLMPREWGRDPFFTFMPRERNEGFGDVHAVVAKAAFAIPQKRLKFNLAGGYFNMPDVTNTVLNKFGLPSYLQVNADMRYAFAGLFQGMDAQLLIVGKLNQGETYQQAKYEMNKVNMVLYNFVLNYHF